MSNVLALKINNDNNIVKGWYSSFSSKETLRSYNYVARSFFNVSNIEMITNNMIKNINYMNVQDYIKTMLDENKSKNTIRKYTECLKSLFNYAQDEMIIEYNPFGDRRMKKLIKNNTEKNSEEVGIALTIKQINQLKEVIDNKRDKLLIFFALRTGCRVNELINVKYKDITFNAEEQNWFLHILGKGRKHRYIFISEKMYNELQEYINNNNNCVIGLSDELIFPMSTSNVNRIVAKWGNKIGVEVTPHDLRRTACSNLINNNVNIRYIQEFMGHSSMAITERYIKGINKFKKNAGKYIKY